MSKARGASGPDRSAPARRLLRVLGLLLVAPRTERELVEATGAVDRTISRDFATLREVGIEVKVEDGSYRVNSKAALRALKEMGR